MSERERANGSVRPVGPTSASSAGLQPTAPVARDPALHRPRRWAVLAAYTLVVGMSQLLWLNFAPLLTMVQSRYGVSELSASLLVLVFPLLYVVFSLPAGALTDRRGYRFTVGLGALGMTVFAALRIWDDRFVVLLVAQMGIAVAQPYVVNGISKLVADWFSEGEGAIATGLGHDGHVPRHGGRPGDDAAAGRRVRSARCDGRLRGGDARVAPPVRLAGAAERGASGDGRRGGAGAAGRAVARSPAGAPVRAVVPRARRLQRPDHVARADPGAARDRRRAGGAHRRRAHRRRHRRRGGDSDAVGRLRRRKPFLLVCAAVALATIHPLCSGQRLPRAPAAGRAARLLLFAGVRAAARDVRAAGRCARGRQRHQPVDAGRQRRRRRRQLRHGARQEGRAATTAAPVWLLVALLLATVLLALLAPETHAQRRDDGAV